MGGHIGWQQGWVEQESFDKDRRWTVDEIGAALRELPAGPSPFEMSA